MLNTIRDAALAKNSFWTAAIWLLERKYPAEYSVNRILAEDVPQIILGINVGVTQSDVPDSDSVDDTKGVDD